MSIAPYTASTDRVLDLLHVPAGDAAPSSDEVGRRVSVARGEEEARRLDPELAAGVGAGVAVLGGHRILEIAESAVLRVLVGARALPVEVRLVGRVVVAHVGVLGEVVGAVEDHQHDRVVAIADRGGPGPEPYSSSNLVTAFAGPMSKPPA